MPVFQEPSHFPRDRTTTTFTTTTSTAPEIYTGSNVTPAASETAPTGHPFFLRYQISLHTHAVLLFVVAVVLLLSFAASRSKHKAFTPLPGRQHRPIVLLWLALILRDRIRDAIAPNLTRSAHRPGSEIGPRQQDQDRNIKREIGAQTAPRIRIGGVPEKEALEAQQLHQQQLLQPQGLAQNDACHHRTHVRAEGGPAAVRPHIAAGVAVGLVGPALAGGATAALLVPAVTGAAAGMDPQRNQQRQHQTQQGSRGVSANSGAGQQAQRRAPAAEKAAGRLARRSASSSSPSSRQPAPGQTDGGLPDSPIMDGDSWPGASALTSPHEAPLAVERPSAAFAARANVSADDNSSSTTPTSRTSPAAAAFSSAPMPVPAAFAGTGSSAAAGVGAGIKAGSFQPGAGSGRGLGSGGDRGFGSSSGFATPSQFQFVSRPPVLTPPAASSAYGPNPALPPFQDRRPSRRGSIPPVLDLVSRESSFAHHPNPDYLSVFGSGEETDSRSGSSGQDSYLSLSTTTSTEFPSLGPTYSPPPPLRTTSYTRTVPIGGHTAPPPVAIHGSSHGGGRAWAHHQPGDESPPSSSFPSSSPYLPPPPPHEISEYGHDATFFDRPPRYYPLPQHTAHHAGPEHGDPHSIDVHGEISSMTDDAGASWRRHTRAYGGGPCLACLRNGGGFYGPNVPLEERVPR